MPSIQGHVGPCPTYHATMAQVPLAEGRSQTYRTAPKYTVSLSILILLNLADVVPLQNKHATASLAGLTSVRMRTVYLTADPSTVVLVGAATTDIPP